MAGRRKAEVVPSRALVASVVAFQGEGIGEIPRVYRPMEQWQKDAWRFYDITPELRFASGWIGNALSRCVLLPALVNSLGQLELTDDATMGKALSVLFSGSVGQAEMLHSFGLHLTVAGECYLVGRKEEPNPGLIWEVIGVNEISRNGSSWQIKLDGALPITLTKTDVVIRIWRPHPVNRMRADSPVRALLPVLTEIEYLTRHVFSQTTSRLAGAGVWVLPDTVEFPGSTEGNKAEGLMKLLGKAMTTSLRDPGHPSSLMPVVITAAGDAIKDIKGPLHFWSPLDDAAVNLRNAGIARFCVGMDLPPEVIQGMSAARSSGSGAAATVSHWSSWQIEEAAIKLHVEPLLEVIANGVAIGYMRVVTNNPKAAILYDATKLKLQPDRSKEALELAQMGKLSDESLRKFSGFNEDDKPSDEEYRRWLLVKIVGTAATPEQVAEALRLLGIPSMPDTGGPMQPGNDQPPSLREHPAPRGPPERLALLSAVAEPLVLRALEKAGNRLRNAGVRPPGTPAQEAYLYAPAVNGNACKLLEDAWSLVPQVCQGIAEPDALTKVLNAYTESLLTQQAPHSREGMQRYLALMDE